MPRYSRNAASGPVLGMDVCHRRRDDRRVTGYRLHDHQQPSLAVLGNVMTMSARPGRIKSITPVQLVHPRHYTIKAAPEFTQMRLQLTEEIRNEAILAAEGIR